jgi:hypothetical protein
VPTIGTLPGARQSTSRRPAAKSELLDSSSQLGLFLGCHLYETDIGCRATRLSHGNGDAGGQFFLAGVARSGDRHRDPRCSRVGFEVSQQAQLADRVEQARIFDPSHGCGDAAPLGWLAACHVPAYRPFIDGGARSG